MTSTAHRFNTGTPESWGVTLSEFTRGRTRRQRVASIDARREKIVRLCLERNEGTLASLRRDLLSVGTASPEDVVSDSLDRFRRRLASDLEAGALVGHLSALWAGYVEAGVARGSSSAARPPAGRVRLSRTGARGWTRAPLASTTRKASSASTLRAEVLRYVEGRLRLTDEEVEAISAEYSPYAFQLAGQPVNDRMRRRLEETLREIVARDLHGKHASKLLGEQLAALGLTPDSSFAVEGLVRTQIQLAYSAASVHADRDPAIAEILWGYEYATVGDDRVRPTHQALDGVTLPKEDPRWRVIMPPNGFACRCTALRAFGPLATKAPPAEVEIDGKRIVPDADEGFKYNPGDIFERIVALPRRTD